MTDASLKTGGLKTDGAKRLKKRHAAEARFQFYGRAAIVLALTFLALLLGRIVQQGYTTFSDNQISVSVYLDPNKIDRADLSGSNYDYLVSTAVLKMLGLEDDDLGLNSTDAAALVSRDLGFQILNRIKADPSLIGKTITVSGSMKGEANLYYNGQIKRSTPEADRKLNNRQIAWLDRLKKEGKVTGGFNTAFFTNGDSTEPEQAGILGALVGSALTLLVAALIAIPVGVLASVWLEEFAPKNRWTDLIEVNINNLAAVPSIIFGLLGLAVFINVLHAPRGAPLTAGIVLALMALPTVIIATRSSLKAVPPSIRDGALAIGASRTQTVFHHVLPLATPGVMTGAILSLAHALGETAPLLMIGMVAFNPGVPTNFTGGATVLPVLIYIWENASERAFQERTAAAIIVLLVFMVLMNIAAIILRRRFERRW